MGMNYGDINWIAILACVIAGQVFLTLWFAVLFGEPWAKAYGAADKAQHTKEIPGYTYGIGALCVLLVSLGLAVLQKALVTTTLGGAIGLGVFVAIHFCIATAVPGYAFLRRWSACALAVGSQVVLIVLLSVILVLFG